MGSGVRAVVCFGEDLFFGERFGGEVTGGWGSVNTGLEILRRMSPVK